MVADHYALLCVWYDSAVLALPLLGPGAKLVRHPDADALGPLDGLVALEAARRLLGSRRFRRDLASLFPGRDDVPRACAEASRALDSPLCTEPGVMERMRRMVG